MAIINIKFKIDNLKLIIITSIITLAAVLRFHELGTNPPGLYWDEAVFGYDAYSILKTAQDHHGRFLPLFFESFGDWKLPVYHYLLVPSIATFGLSEFAVRFPSALFGTATVVIFWLLVRLLTGNLPLASFAAFFLAISPWHIQFSRGGFESTVGLFFVVSGIYLFLWGLEKHRRLILTFAFLLFTLSMYSYHAYRIFTPLFAVALAIIFWPKIKRKITSILPAFVLSIILLIPLASFTFSPQGRARAISQSAFNKQQIENTRLDYDQKSKKPLRFLSRYLYQGPLYWSYLALSAYIDHFSPVFLFIKGDQIGRHSQVDMGQIYAIETGLFILAIFALKNLNPRTKWLMLSFLLISPLPATIVTPTPHAYRTLQMTIPLAFFSGLGAAYLFSLNKLGPIKSIFIILATFSFVYYLHLLIVHYPVKFSADWQDGYRAMVWKITQFQNDYEQIYITNINQVPYIYLLFYQRYDPQKYIKQGTAIAFDKYHFISPEDDIYNKEEKLLYVAPSWQKVDGRYLDSVNDSIGRHLYTLWEVESD